MEINIASLIEEALHAGRNARSGWTYRADGWTPERIRTFLTVLAERGIAADAARTAGLSVRSAYALRAKAGAGAFDRAWRAAQSSARQRRTDRAVSRTIARSLVPIIRDGKVWGIWHRHDNRFDMATLTRLDRHAASMGKEIGALRDLAGHFEMLVELACVACVTAPELTRSDGSGPDSETEERQR